MTLLFVAAVAVVFIVLATAKFNLHPVLALLLAALGYGLFVGMPPVEVVKAINAGFGNIVGSIGIVIIAGTIIGIFLERSGGALALAHSVLRRIGPRHTPLAMSVLGYIVSIPVFCDSAFVLLSPINKALARTAKTSVAAGAIALSLGLYATHTMVPPTPGPIAAAAMLEADLGLVIVWGMLIGAIAGAGGWVFAVTVAAKVHVPEETREIIEDDASTAPGTLKTLLPILVPILLIVARSVAELPAKPMGEGRLADLLLFLGQPAVALMIGVLLALLLPRRLDRNMLSTNGWVGEAIAAAATIIIITGAGGAFGKVLQDSGIGDVISGNMGGLQGIGIWLPMLLAAGLKTAQGSSTVAMITTAGIIGPLLPTLGLDGENARALTAVAIGAGAMMVSHANDSYFWVVTQFSGLSIGEGYRLQTLGTLVQGLVAATAITLAAWVVL